MVLLASAVFIYHTIQTGGGADEVASETIKKIGINYAQILAIASQPQSPLRLEPALQARSGLGPIGVFDNLMLARSYFFRGRQPQVSPMTKAPSRRLNKRRRWRGPRTEMRDRRMVPLSDGYSRSVRIVWGPLAHAYAQLLTGGGVVEPACP